eukprot:TRINITY_DN40529_c0_g1_i1.p1 TRINITY_DN40529_c0_g1~~TRINITY_DN40529_c0_g1_i1.p1  ORF type:complete len:175 (-),score=26.53 TRINITY_DN40529_c0_g1_i1:29-553(-)
MANPLHVDTTSVEFTEVLPFQHPFRAFEMYLFRPDMAGFSTESYTGLPPIYRRAIAQRTVHRLQELIPGIGPPKRSSSTARPVAVGEEGDAAVVPIPPNNNEEDAVLEAQVYGGRESDWRDRLILWCLYSSKGSTLSSVQHDNNCLLYTSDAADEEDSVDLGGRRIIKKKKREQ